MADMNFNSVKYAKVNHDNIPEQPLRPDKKTRSGRSWRAPTIILSTLLVGLGVALAHHFMNVRLNNRSIEGVMVSQAWISRFNTALAFLAKLSFTVSVGASFTQHQWLRFQQQSFKIAEIDAVTSVLANFPSFFSSPIWFRHPILVLTALASWVIPFAAVVTPSSLSVLPVRTTATMMLQVPQPLYNYTNYGHSAGGGGSNAITTYPRLLTLAYATASTAQPVSLSSIYQNETYHLQFNGPAVKCGTANESLIRNVSLTYGGYSGGGNTLYKSWVPGNEADFTARQYSNAETLDYYSIDGARIFIMSNLGSSNITVNATTGATQVNVTECLLFNATYDVDFTFQFPQQTRHVNISTWLNPVFTPKFGHDQDLGGRADAIFSYCAMMNAFGKLLVGQEYHSHYDIDTNYYTSWRIMDINWSRSEAVEAGLEQLFQNYTLSLLSDNGLIKNSTLAASVPVTVETWPVTYVYSRFDLLLAYGLSFLAACICAVVGLIAFFVNRDSYQNLFSTFLRVTNDPQMRALIDPEDTGADPLPKHLAQMSVRVLGKGESE